MVPPVVGRQWSLWSLSLCFVLFVCLKKKEEERRKKEEEEEEEGRGDKGGEIGDLYLGNETGWRPMCMRKIWWNSTGRVRCGAARSDGEMRRGANRNKGVRALE